MRTVTFHIDAFNEYNNWAVTNPKLFDRLTKLIKETLRTPFSGIGKPEPLKLDYRGYWSRRIDNEHRLVYKVTDEQIIILSCYKHYQNKN